MNEPTKKQGAARQADRAEDVRTGLSGYALRRGFNDHLHYTLGRVPEMATPHDRYMAAAYTTRDRLLDCWTRTVKSIVERGARMVAYLSAERDGSRGYL